LPVLYCQKKKRIPTPLPFFIKVLQGNVSAGFESSLKDADKIEYWVENVRRREVTKVTVEEYLNTAKLKMKNMPETEAQLKEGKLYIIIEQFRTNSFSFAVSNQEKKYLKLESSVKNLISGDIEYDKEKSTDEKLSYKGRLYVTFGVVPARILYDEKEQNFHIDIDYKTPTVRGDSINIEPLNEEEGLIELFGCSVR